MIDNRVTYIALAGRDYPLCLSVSAYDAFVAQYGGLEGWLAELQSGDDCKAVAATLGFMSIMLNGGHDRIETLCRLSGEKANLPPRLTLDDLRAIVTIGDLSTYQTALVEAYRSSNSQTVEVAEDKAKNAETT